jgi:hypothetical protein
MTTSPTDTMPELIWIRETYGGHGRGIRYSGVTNCDDRNNGPSLSIRTEYIRADLVPDAALLKEAHDVLDEYSIMYQQMKEAFIRGAAWHTIEAQWDNMDCAKRETATRYATSWRQD